MNSYFKIVAIALLFPAFIVKAQKLPYTNQTDAGLLLGQASETVFTAQSFHGVKISKWKLETGITAGIDVYPQMTILPVSLAFKWNPFNSGIVSPLISLNAGYGFGWLQPQQNDTRYPGGYTVNPSLGLRIKTKNNAKLNLGVGFRQQKAVVRQRHEYYLLNFMGGSSVDMKDEYTFRRASLMLGLSF